MCIRDRSYVVVGKTRKSGLCVNATEVGIWVPKVGAPEITEKDMVLIGNGFDLNAVSLVGSEATNQTGMMMDVP